MVLRSAAGAVLRSQSWVYDASSKVTHHTVDGVTTTYTYDGAGQLLSESRPGYQATYTYDGNGNRLTRTVNAVTEAYTYDAGDKLLSVSVGGVVVRSFGYDAAGRTTSVTSSAGTTTLTYDFEGRATSIVGPGISQFNVFNGLDTRVGSTTNSVTRTFLRDGAYVTDPVLSDGAAFYTPGVSERRGGVTTFLHSGLKNADAQSTASGLTGARQYDAFGNLLSSSGSWQGPFGYAGAFGYQEDATGLMLLGHRLYDPSTGRFLTRDPIQDGRNWYVYCGNDPVNWLDPDGLKPRGHHYVPGPIRGAVSPAAKSVFEGATTGPIPGGHGWGHPHPEYNRRVEALWKEYLGAIGKRPGEVSADEARRFVELIKNSKDPVIRGMLDDIYARIRAGSPPKPGIGRRVAGGVLRKIPFVGWVLIGYDGVVHGPERAIRNATWPLSELVPAR